MAETTIGGALGDGFQAGSSASDGRRNVKAALEGRKRLVAAFFFLIFSPLFAAVEPFGWRRKSLFPPGPPFAVF